jgi:hypothetical protein
MSLTLPERWDSALTRISHRKKHHEPVVTLMRQKAAYIWLIAACAKKNSAKPGQYVPLNRRRAGSGS